MSDSEIISLLRELIRLVKRDAKPASPDPPYIDHDEPKDTRSVYRRFPQNPGEYRDEYLLRIARIEKAEGTAVWESDLRRSIPKPVPPKRPSWSWWE
jgi:hypothetical protein